ncbi:type I methionyl aminopeptidase [bacterium]|nr:MAG: type I methionyl aminopeptidase [bacterium]
MIHLKSQEELQMLRRSGRILSLVMRKVSRIVRPGIATADIDRLAEKLILDQKASPAFKGYKGFPATACISVNEEIVHGIPGPRVLLEGDIVSIDLGVNYQGYFSDAAITLAVGKIEGSSKKLIDTAKEALDIGIHQASPGNNLGDISRGIQDFVEGRGFSVVRQFVGHGIGKALHEEPEVPNFGQAHCGPELKSGMVLAIEPMINIGGWECRITDNGWTAVTSDGSYSAHFEHTVAITDKGPEILTK